MHSPVFLRVQPPSQGASSWCHRTAPCAGLWTRVGIVCRKRDCILIDCTRGWTDTRDSTLLFYFLEESRTHTHPKRAPRRRADDGDPETRNK
eukprot:scaffold37018_cov73-Phaeocystis_antarctica.AAC.3